MKYIGIWSPPLISALLSLTNHSISHSPPNQWVPNLAVLINAEPGRQLLHNFPTEPLEKYQGDIAFWHEIAKVWPLLKVPLSHTFGVKLLRSCAIYEGLMPFLLAVPAKELSGVLLFSLLYSNVISQKTRITFLGPYTQCCKVLSGRSFCH